MCHGKDKNEGKIKQGFLKVVTSEWDYKAWVSFFAGDREMRSRKSKNILDLIVYSTQLVNVG